MNPKYFHASPSSYFFFGLWVVLAPIWLPIVGIGWLAWQVAKWVQR